MLLFLFRQGNKSEVFTKHFFLHFEDDSEEIYNSRYKKINRLIKLAVTERQLNLRRIPFWVLFACKC